MHFKKTKMIFFDFDGVIVDSFDIAFKCLKEMIPDLTAQEFRSCYNGNFGEEIQRIRNISDYRELARTFTEKYSSLIGKESLFQDMDKILIELSEEYYLSIISSNTNQAINRLLEESGIENRIDEVLGMDFHGSKVEKFKFIMEKYKIINYDCLMVTDTVGDIKEARLLEIPCIAVAWGYHKLDDLKKEKPKYLVTQPDQLISAINKEFN